MTNGERKELFMVEGTLPTIAAEFAAKNNAIRRRFFELHVTTLQGYGDALAEAYPPHAEKIAQIALDGCEMDPPSIEAWEELVAIETQLSTGAV